MDEIEGYTIWYTHKVNKARRIGNITHTKGKKEDRSYTFMFIINQFGQNACCEEEVLTKNVITDREINISKQTLYF